jgi:hypothetical protein
MASLSVLHGRQRIGRDGVSGLTAGRAAAGPFEGSQERRTGRTSERLEDDQMSLLRSHRVCTVFRGGGAAQLFSLRGVRGDSRSDGPPPRRREPEGSGPATSAATPCLRRREAARQSRIHPVTQRALTAAFSVLHREHLTEHLAETGDASRSNFVTGCRPSSTEPSALVARWPGRIKRPALAVVSALAARRRDRLLPPRRSFSEILLEGNGTPRRAWGCRLLGLRRSTSDFHSNRRMPLLRSNRALAFHHRGGATGLSSLGGVRSDSRSGQPTPCRRARESGRPRGDPPTA